MKRVCFLSMLFSMLNMASMVAQNDSLLAFPTAEGYGKYTVGGRGGMVYVVTNLNDSGEGSLRAAVEQSGARTVVFAVSGTIALKSPLTIKHPYITIAGQTAPGDGICIRNYPLRIDADEVIIRHIRVRLGDETGIEDDAISSRYHKNLILDHVSASWSIDETVSIYLCSHVTIQWCMIAESLFDSNHQKGTHGFGGIWGSNYSTYHHNLLAHHSSRNPRWASGSGYNDYRNNVIYNWGYNSAYGGEWNQPRPRKGDFFEINMVGNYYKPGPATLGGNVGCRVANPSHRHDDDFGRWYIAGNYMEGSSRVTADNWDGGVVVSGDTTGTGLRRSTPWPSMPIVEQSAEEAYRLVLDNAGAVLPRRDAVDSRIVDDVRCGGASCEGAAYKQRKNVPDATRVCGIIDSQNDAGGWPVLKNEKAPLDSDGDGMPDAWEKAHGLNPHKADNNRLNADGYTAIEVYINSLAGECMNEDFD